MILEPMNVVGRRPGFLEALQHAAPASTEPRSYSTRRHRFPLHEWRRAGALGVTPDLASFGKDGERLSALGGGRQADIMQLMEEIFFSFTFGGETLSLAAATATLRKLRREPVTERLAAKGRRCQPAIEAMIRARGLTDTFTVTGHPSWPSRHP